MSRGFVKEEDQEELPVIPPRAALPVGATNYVTPNGLALLLAEKADLETAKKDINTKDEAQHRRELAFLNGKLALLQERIDSAKVVDNSLQDHDEVRFGALVTY